MVPLFVAFAMAFFARSATPAGAWAAIVVGFAAGVVFSYWRQLVGRFVPTGDFSVILILPTTLLCSLAAGLLTSWLTQSSRRPAEAPAAAEPS
jgi:fructose-specific phosphotransferase system IIC component